MMNKLLELIIQTLRTKHERVYHESAPDNAIYPYIIFNVSDGFKSHRDDLTLIIDIWDRSSSSFEIENLTDSIDNLLDEANIYNEFVLTTFYRQTRMKVEDPDIKLKRRQLRFNIQTYFKEV